ncbi:MAG TPA: SPFH domain-containing protein [Fimbriimonas sp.]|nr:SPFH domain-containing protein [Fimbriimonas sp.]
MPHFQGKSTDFVFHYVGGRLKHQGLGKSFWYMSFNSTIAVVPTNVQDVPFVFQDVTSDHQTVTCQGQLSYRFSDPATTVKNLNLTVHPRTGAYVSNDLEKLAQRMGNAVRIAASAEIQSRTLAINLRDFREFSARVLERLRQDPVLTESGAEAVTLTVLAVQPTPEVAKALEAEFRESLLRKADEAIYARRAASVEEERKIKEKELATELAVAESKRKIIEQEGQNMIAQAESRGKALESESRYKNEQLAAELELWKTVDPALISALGFRLLGAKGANNLTITSEVLSVLLGAKAADSNAKV